MQVSLTPGILNGMSGMINITEVSLTVSDQIDKKKSRKKYLIGKSLSAMDVIEPGRHNFG